MTCRTTNLGRGDRYKLHQRPLLKHAVSWKHTLEEEELQSSAAKILTGPGQMERIRQAFWFGLRKWLRFGFGWAKCSWGSLGRGGRSGGLLDFSLSDRRIRMANLA